MADDEAQKTETEPPPADVESATPGVGAESGGASAGDEASAADKAAAELEAVMPNEIVMMLASAVLIFAAMEVPIQTWGCTYCYVCGGVGLFVCLVAFFMGISDNKWLAYFLAVWYVPAAAIFTQNTPFVYISNGYIASWAVAYASMANARKHGADSLIACEGMLDDETDAKEQGYKHTMFIANIICFWATLGDDVQCAGNESACQWITWAQVCSGVSLFITLLWHIPMVGKMVSNLDKPVCAFLAIWWCVGTWTMTFEQPFTGAGNGWASAWVSGICALLLAHYQFKEVLGGYFGGSDGTV